MLRLQDFKIALFIFFIPDMLKYSDTVQLIRFDYCLDLSIVIIVII